MIRRRLVAAAASALPVLRARAQPRRDVLHQYPTSVFGVSHTVRCRPVEPSNCPLPLSNIRNGKSRRARKLACPARQYASDDSGVVGVTVSIGAHALPPRPP